MITLSHLNYLHILVATIVGFLFGWLWYSVLFRNSWASEMKITPERMAEGRPAMGGNLAKSFIFTFISAVGLAVVIVLAAIPGWRWGAKVGLAVGLLIVGGRCLNGGLWEGKSARLQAINLGHEVILFAVQGAIIAGWA